MSNKSLQTSLYILEKVAPIFNKQGYMGTSMKSITDAVGLTKGAIYGNFKNKKELAIKAFNYNVRNIIDQVAKHIAAQDSAIDKLFAMTNFYRTYLDFTKPNGGCPILNIGVDANNQKDNELLLERVNHVIKKLEGGIAEIIQKGIDNGEMKSTLDPEKYSKRIFAMIEGSIFMALTVNDKYYVVDMMDHIDDMIIGELKNTPE